MKSVGFRLHLRAVSLSESFLLNVVEDVAESLSLLSVSSDGNGRGSSHLSWFSLNVVLAESEPLSKIVT